MQTIKQLHIIPLTLFLFSLIGCTQAPEKDTTTIINSSKESHSEAGDYPSTKSTTIGPCISKLEENKIKRVADTVISSVHVNFYCLCSDYLTDVKVSLSNKERTYERITDKLGCDFEALRPGKYTLEVEYEAAKKFKPVEVIVGSGVWYEWKIFLCEE